MVIKQINSTSHTIKKREKIEDIEITLNREEIIEKLSEKTYNVLRLSLKDKTGNVRKNEKFNHLKGGESKYQ